MRTDGLMPRHMAWRRQYEERRYARHLSQPELNRRIRDVMLNMLRVNKDAKIDLGEIADEGVAWMEKWTHVLQEMQLRHGPYPAGFTREILHSERFPNFASELAGKAARRLAILRAKIITARSATMSYHWSSRSCFRGTRW